MKNKLIQALIKYYYSELKVIFNYFKNDKNNFS